jgi:endonuclease/exonuclease/phosphatase family metal-dependent hydrolase
MTLRSSSRSLATLLAAAFLQAIAAAGAASQGGPLSESTSIAPVVVRVLSYNIRHGEGRDGRIDLKRIADVMKGADPDLIALQEVDRGTDRSGRVDQLAELARQTGMHAEFGKAIDYEGGEYGVAVLSRWPIQTSENRPLPSSPDNEGRTALSVLLKVGPDGPVLRFTSTHLSQSRWVDDGLAQAAQLNHLLVTQSDVPGILAGDFNARTDTDVMRALQGVWTIASAAPATSPGPDPQPPSRRGRGPRNDYVLFRPAERWRVLEASIIDETTASDHRPVLAVLEWGDTSRADPSSVRARAVAP